MSNIAQVGNVRMQVGLGMPNFKLRYLAQVGAKWSCWVKVGPKAIQMDPKLKPCDAQTKHGEHSFKRSVVDNKKRYVMKRKNAVKPLLGEAECKCCTTQLMHDVCI